MPRYVVRGGYGIYYGLNSYGNSAELGDGYTATTLWNPSTDNGVTQQGSLVPSFQNPFPAGVVQPSGSALGAMTDIGNYLYGPTLTNSPSPRIQQWSLSVERELPHNSVVEIAYSGSKGNRLGMGSNRQWANTYPVSALSLGNELNNQYPNPFQNLVPATAFASSPTLPLWALLLPHPQEPEGIYPRPGPPWGNPLYHSGYIQFTKRISQGLQLTAHYTYSKLIDDSESADEPNLNWLAGGIGGNNPYVLNVQDWGHLRQSERSVSELDIRHRLVTDFTYKLPVGRGRTFGRSWNQALDDIAGGWQVSGFMTFASGMRLIPGYTSNSFPGSIYYQVTGQENNPRIVQLGLKFVF